MRQTPTVKSNSQSIKGPEGVEGTHNFEPTGDGVHGYNVVRKEKGKVVLIEHIEFDLGL